MRLSLHSSSKHRCAQCAVSHTTTFSTLRILMLKRRRCWSNLDSARHSWKSEEFWGNFVVEKIPEIWGVFTIISRRSHLSAWMLLRKWKGTGQVWLRVICKWVKFFLPCNWFSVSNCRCWGQRSGGGWWCCTAGTPPCSGTTTTLTSSEELLRRNGGHQLKLQFDLQWCQ